MNHFSKSIHEHDFPTEVKHSEGLKVNNEDTYIE